MLKRESRFRIVKSAGKITVYILMIIPISCVDTEIAFNYCGSSCEEAGRRLTPDRLSSTSPASAEAPWGPANRLPGELDEFSWVHLKKRSEHGGGRKEKSPKWIHDSLTKQVLTPLKRLEISLGLQPSLCSGANATPASTSEYSYSTGRGVVLPSWFANDARLRRRSGPFPSATRRS